MKDRAIKSIEEIYNIRHFSEANIQFGQRVLLRVDFNVPFFIESSEISDFTRIDAVMQTVKTLIELGAKIILISHLGDPKTLSNRKNLSFSRIATHLSLHFYKQLGEEMGFIEDVVGESDSHSINSKISTLFQKYNIVLLENLRFCSGEKSNDIAFANTLSNFASVYINDAFSCMHRKHASIVLLPTLLPSYAGSALWEELTSLELLLNSETMMEYTKSKIAIVGGKKVSTKISVLSALSNKFDYLIIAGAMANTFLRAMNIPIGDSFFEEEMLMVAKNFMIDNKKTKIILPSDVVLSDFKVVDITQNSSLDLCNIVQGKKIYDIGKKTLDIIFNLLKNASLVVWNGPVGYYEHPSFNEGTKAIANYIVNSVHMQQDTKSIIGGGDTIAALSVAGFRKGNFTHVSCGGGAFLEWLTNKNLCGITALRDIS